MTSIVKFTPLSGGGQSLDPHCYILQVDAFTFLLDCGWDFVHFESPHLSVVNRGTNNDELSKWIGKIDAVLVSYPDLVHLGGLPYAVGKLGLQCPESSKCVSSHLP